MSAPDTTTRGKMETITSETSHARVNPMVKPMVERPKDRKSIYDGPSRPL